MVKETRVILHVRDFAKTYHVSTACAASRAEA